MPAAPFLSITDLSFAYGEKSVLQQINIDVSPGEFIGIIGPNGAGKSTLVKLIAGLQHNYSGNLQLAQREIPSYSSAELAHQIAYVPQHIALEFPFSVKEIVQMGRFPHHQGPIGLGPRDEQATAEAINSMDLGALENRLFTQLSGGEKQRVIVASALAQESELLLLDEPTTALDLRHQQLILTRLRDIGKTTFLVTHDINLAAQFCKRIILLDKGIILADADPQTVLNFELIQKVYGVKVYIDLNPFTKSIYILPYEAN